MKNKNHIVIKNNVILNLMGRPVGDLQRLLSSLVNSMRGRGQIMFGMTPLFNNNAFTLIELLVVVLIIGTLAAVALPQYQKAVKKTYLAEWATYWNGYAKAIDAWLLANGYPDEGDIIEFTGISANPRIHANLDIDFVCDSSYGQANRCETKAGGFHVGCENDHCWINMGADSRDSKLLKKGEAFNVKRKSSENSWMLEQIFSSDTQTVKLLCQYWKEHYGGEHMYETARTTCAAVGIE